MTQVGGGVGGVGGGALGAASRPGCRWAFPSYRVTPLRRVASGVIAAALVGVWEWSSCLVSVDVAVVSGYSFQGGRWGATVRRWPVLAVVERVDDGVVEDADVVTMGEVPARGSSASWRGRRHRDAGSLCRCLLSSAS